MEYKLIVENFRNFAEQTLEEDVYTPELRKFIEYANELESKFERGDDWMAIVRELNKYANEHFKFIGSGISRTVFRTPGREIVKMISNEPFNSVAAMEAMEKEIATFDRHDISTIFPRIYEKSDMNLWFVTEEMTPFANVHENYKSTLVRKWFPELYELAELGQKLEPVRGMRTPTSIRPTAILRIAALLASRHANKSSKSSESLLMTAINSFAEHTRGNHYAYIPSKVPKEYIEKIYDYFRSPDRLVKTMAHVLKATNTKFQDFHGGNVAFDDDENMKIIDL